ncbi:hypothetical protein BX591_102641 [Paraburkholderia bryophila]|uniref:Uncharacterized protein n=2 Tax=Paraburkholderia bryophila TaxID=420952 RepID=A0A329CU34_9BURK|nr:hypothetical protein BX591_102641 [Paraburkholderia bryophila]
MPTVKIESLQQLATSENGPYMIGELCRRLVYNWVPNRLIGMSFHSGTANNLPGWDGWVQLAETDDQPPHFSLWELSTQDADRAKILSDVKKSFRRTLPVGWEQKRTIYVAVTLRKLSDKDALEQEIAALSMNPWGYVRIIDAPALVQWIEMCPAVEAWCAETLRIGDGRFGISLETFWRRWSTATRPAISTGLLVAGRPQEEMDALFAPQQAGSLTLLSDSAEETAAYVYAYLLNAKDQDGTSRALSNALVISSVEAANRYADEPAPQGRIPISILLPPANAAANALVSAGHYVINAIGRASPSVRPKTLARALRGAFSQALETTMDFTAEEAEQQARASGGSVSVWSVWNRFEANALATVPDWCASSEVPHTVPAVFAAGWDDNLASDKDALSLLSLCSYSAFRSSVAKHIASDPPLLQRVGNIYSVLAPTVAFALMAKSITKEQLLALEDAIADVFSRIDSKLVETWETAPSVPLSSAPEHHSDWLRRGLLETLLRISVFSDVLDAADVAHEFGGCQAFVDRVAQKNSYFRSEPRFLAALSENLPLLAEAAPIPFVEALEELLQGSASASAVAPLFADRGLFGPVMHAGVLWALECLAWSPDLLPRVAVILARLSELDTGARVVNRPSNTLRSIFLAWNPGTSASLAQRIEILHILNEQVPATTWQLAHHLLPQPYDSSTSTYEPMWKDFGRSNRERPTATSVRESYRAYVEFTLQLSNGDLSRQKTLLERYPELSPEHRSVLCDQLLGSAKIADISDSVREQVWDSVRRLAAKHRRFSKAQWAMRPADIDAIEAVGKLFRPTSRLTEIQWLFDENFPDAAGLTDDFESAQHRLDEMRDEAMRELAADGITAIDELFKRTKRPYLVAQQVAVSLDDTASVIDLLSGWAVRMTSSDKLGIRSLCAARYFKHKEKWTRVIKAAAEKRRWPACTLGLCLADYPDEALTLEQVKTLSEEAGACYWKNRSEYLRTTDSAVAIAIAGGLIAHGRAIGLVNQKLAILGTTVAMAAMRAALSELVALSSPVSDSMLGYNLKENLNWLSKEGETPKVELAKMEFSLLPVLLDELHDGEQLLIHRALAENPELFVSVVCEIYRPAHQAEDDIEDNPQSSEFERQRATVAWSVLREWRTPPGVNGSGRLDYSLLMAWLTEARRGADVADRAEVGDHCIGAVLFHTPGEHGSGDWPSTTLNRALEELASDAVESGLEVEAYNARGVTTRAMLEGGHQERDLAAQWTARANALPSRWQRAKRMCERIATSWAQTAKQMDERAAQRRLRH